MVPDQGLFATGIGSERTLNTALRSRDGQRALAYLSSQTTVLLHLDKIAAKNVQVTWISPVTGEKKDAGTYLTGNLNGKTFPREPHADVHRAGALGGCAAVAGSSAMTRARPSSHRLGLGRASCV